MTLTKQSRAQSGSQPSETIRDEPVRVPRSAEDMLHGSDAGRIAEISPEGVPANAGLRGRGIALLISGAVLVVAIVSVVTGLVAGSAAGWGVLIVGMLLALVVNPVVYASVLRAREREHAIP